MIRPCVFIFLLICLSNLRGAISDDAVPNNPATRWWKGNLHTHSHWSDGDDYPEMIAEWYKTNGYNFLALSDHNTLLTGTKWITITNSKGGEAAFRKYLARFGPRWVETRNIAGKRQVRLKTLDEFRKKMEERDRFLMIPSEEISDKFGKLPIHLNASNLRDYIHPQGGRSVVDVLQRNVDAVLAQRAATGQPMIPHINHPNFGWALTVEDLMQVRGERFFEVYNGHPSVHNEGDANRMSTERMWDIALAFRLTRLGLGTLYGMAVDDSHNYHKWSTTNVNPGRGWVMVRSSRLRAESLIEAMDAGDFYASTGVRLADVRRTSRELQVNVEPEAGVSYLIQFIGTRQGFEVSDDFELRRLTLSTLERLENPPATRSYGFDIGEMLAETRGTQATYTLDGDEIYVRAKIISSKPKLNGYRADEVEVAWTQPLIPQGR